MKEFIYPDLRVMETATSISLSTTLRKESNGKWYLWEFYKSWYFKDDIEMAKRQAIDIFHKEVYFTLICGKVLGGVKDSYGEFIFKEDMRQISEFDRIREITSM